MARPLCSQALVARPTWHAAHTAGQQTLHLASCPTQGDPQTTGAEAPPQLLGWPPPSGGDSALDPWPLPFPVSTTLNGILPWQGVFTTESGVSLLKTNKESLLSPKHVAGGHLLCAHRERKAGGDPVTAHTRGRSCSVSRQSSLQSEQARELATRGNGSTRT